MTLLSMLEDEKLKSRPLATVKLFFNTMFLLTFCYVKDVTDWELYLMPSTKRRTAQRSAAQQSLFPTDAVVIFKLVLK